MVAAAVIVLVILLNIPKNDCRLNGEGRICGRPIGSAFKLQEDRIVAGYDVGYYRYPWYVALMDEDIIACGGSLISSKIVVTAAHCYKEYLTLQNSNQTVKLEDIYTVVLGVYNKCEKEKTQKIVKVEKVIVHEKYKDSTPYYDIALLVLKENVTSFEPICVSKNVIKTRPREGTVPGLGTIRYHGPTPCTLHEARLLIYSDEECRQMLNKTGTDPKKLYGAFCAGYLQGGIDTCQGDSGGPLQIMDEYGTYILLGIVSFGFHCANPGLLGVYTDASHYSDWIEEKTGFKPTIETSNSTNSNSSEEVTTSQKPAKPSPKPPQPKPPHGNHHPMVFVRPYWRPINIFIMKNNKMVQVRKNVKHIPVKSHGKNSHL